MKKYLLTAMIVLGFAAMVHAAPVGLTSEADLTEGELWADKDLALSVGIIGDIVNGRSIDIDSGDFEMTAFIARFGLTALERFTFYVDIGTITDAELSYQTLGENHTAKYDDDELMYGVGASALIKRWDNGLEVGANISYRTSEMTLLSVNEGQGTADRTTANGLVSISTDDYTEQQIALEVAWRTDYFAPYVGIKYSDVELGSQYTLAPNTFNARGDSSENIGFFAGLSIAPQGEAFGEIKRLSINLEGRFLAEEAFNVGLAYKF